MPSRDVERPRWHKPVLLLALLLVVGQVVVFIALRSHKKSQISAPTTPTLDAPAGPDDLVLVLGPGTPSVSAEQIRNVYLGRTTVWPNGMTAHPLNRPAETPAAKAFYGDILALSDRAFADHWSEIQRGGGIAPETVSSGALVVARVAATSGGLGYVLDSELPENTAGVRLVRLK
jgi:hypothetical protein